MPPPEPGTPLPDVTLYEAAPLSQTQVGPDVVSDQFVHQVKLRDVFAGKKGVLVNMFAFAPCCTKLHLPSYIQAYEKYCQSGCDVIVVTALADPFVLAGWAETQGALGKPNIRFLADTYGELGKALDILRPGMNPGGHRSRMYSACIKDNVIQTFNLEPDDEHPVLSMAEPTLEQLQVC